LCHQQHLFEKILTDVPKDGDGVRYWKVSRKLRTDKDSRTRRLSTSVDIQAYRSNTRDYYSDTSGYGQHSQTRFKLPPQCKFQVFTAGVIQIMVFSVVRTSCSIQWVRSYVLKACAASIFRLT